MANPQMKIRAGVPLQAALRATGGDEFPTGRINSIAERYLAIVEEARPALSRNEWMAIFDANNGLGISEEIDGLSGHGPRLTWTMLWANVEDSLELGEKWQIDQAALVKKLQSLSTAAAIAIVETTQRFWALAHLSDSQALDLATSHPAAWPDHAAA